MAAAPRHTCGPDAVIDRVYLYCRVRDRAATLGPAGLRGPHSTQGWARRVGTDKSETQLVDDILDALAVLEGPCAACQVEHEDA